MMVRPWFAGLALGLAIVAQPAAARDQPIEPTYPEAAPSGGLQPNAIRLEIGGASISRGYYCAYGYYTANCGSVGPILTPLLFYGEYERLFAPWLGFDIGLRFETGPYYNQNKQLWDPTADVVFRLGDPRGGPSFRIRAGFGLWIGSEGKTGAVGRFGLGGTIKGHGALGVAIDAVWETGSFQGHTVAQGQYSIGPEFAF